ncbi:MetS family NSS transporter small subunit [Desulfothermus okinawensis]
MSTGSILMMIFGIAVTWGGAITCIGIALKKRDL